jgi:hypothetical protein
VLFQHHHANSRPRQKKAEHHSGRSAAGDAALRILRIHGAVRYGLILGAHGSRRASDKHFQRQSPLGSNKSSHCDKNLGKIALLSDKSSSHFRRKRDAKRVIPHRHPA